MDNDIPRRGTEFNQNTSYYDLLSHDTKHKRHHALHSTSTCNALINKDAYYSSQLMEQLNYTILTCNILQDKMEKVDERFIYLEGLINAISRDVKNIIK